MEPLRLRQIIRPTLIYIFVANFPLFSLTGLIREKEVATSQIIVHTSREGCTVEMDDTLAGKSDAQGALTLTEVEPTDHYLHVQCPGQDEIAFFVSPRPEQDLEIHPGSAGSIVAAPVASPFEAAQAKIHLRQLIQDAIQLRAKGHLELVVQHLRDAAILDPSNSDLHRELGITFLLVKEWKRARVEMIEAIRHEPDDADAHNGLGYALEKLGQTDAALKEYRIATRLDPDDLSYRQHYIDAMSKMAGDQAAKKK